MFVRGLLVEIIPEEESLYFWSTSINDSTLSAISFDPLN